MKDNLSIIITVFLLVLLIVFFPLYNFFERQDDMSYNLVLKATSTFADEVMNNGYIDQRVYDNFISELTNTGNLYDIIVEAHRRVLVKSGTNDEYIEQSYIDYTDDIFEAINPDNSSNLMDRTLKNNIYYFNPKDEIYVKVKNSNTTMAGALFNAIIPTSSKTRIEVNYGGIIKNNAWRTVDATFTGQFLVPSAPILYVGDINRKKITTDYTQDVEGYYQISHSEIVDNGIFASSTFFNGDKINHMHWEITNLENNEITKLNVNSESDSSEVSVRLNSYSFESGKKYLIQVNTVDDKGYSSKITELKINVADSSGGGSPIMLGDLNGNNTVDSEDVRDVISSIIHGGTLSDTEKEILDIDQNNIFDQRDYIELSQNVFGFVLGDVDGDGKISISDHTALAQYINYSEEEPSDEYIRKYDLNFDGTVDINDLTIIQLIANYF